MADETQHPNDDEWTAGPGLDNDAGDGSSDESSDSGDGTPDGEPAASADPGATTAQESLARGLARRASNMGVAGRLTVSFARRDIEVAVDGDAALRLMAAFRGDGHFGDDPDPWSATALAGWVGIDMSQVLAISWLPDPTHVSRIVVDPLV